jgi:hypothetical protein
MGTAASTSTNSAAAATGADRPARRAAALAPAFHETRFGWLVLAAVWIAGAAYLWLNLRYGWIPYDSGQLAQMADRVLRGQVPHRDFNEVYTGGLTYLNALAFRLFGVNFFSLRIPVFLFFLGWLPAVYFLARRFAGPVVAATLTLLAVVWSVPTYPEAMTSWYNLYFATWGALALVRYTEDRRARWLWIAGLCGGFSFLAKISGLYYIAAVLLFLVYREQLLAREPAAEPAPASSPAAAKPALLFRFFVSACLLAFLSALARLVSQQPTFAEFVNFVFPAACLVALLLWSEWRAAVTAPGAARFRRLFAMGAPFLAGVLVPIALFLLWYAHEGAVAAWFRGAFGLAMRHTLWAAMLAPSPLIALGLIPLALVLYLGCASREVTGGWVAPAVIAGLAAILLASRWSLFAYTAVGLSLPMLIPAAAILLLLRLARRDSLSAARRQQIFLLGTVAILWGLVQFPFSSPGYLCYVAPLLILALLALVSVLGNRKRPLILGALVMFYLVFGFWLRAPGYWSVMLSKPSSASSANIPPTVPTSIALPTVLRSTSSVANSTPPAPCGTSSTRISPIPPSAPPASSRPSPTTASASSSSASIATPIPVPSPPASAPRSKYGSPNRPAPAAMK